MSFTTLAHLHIQVTGPWLSIAVASLALLFTVGSFWWLNARQGKLTSFEPQSFAAGVTPDILRLRFPVVLYNTGAKPIVVQDMRLRFLDEPSWSEPLPWVGTRTKIKPDPEDGHDFPAVFALPGRTARQLFIEFGGRFPEVMPLARDYRVQIQVKLGHRRGWHRAVTFTLRGARITEPTFYITYSNSAHGLSEETVRESKAALDQLRSRLHPCESEGPATDASRLAPEA
jgi:hypothetical protein